MSIAGLGYQNYDNVTFKKMAHTLQALDITDGTLELEFPTGGSGTFKPLQFHFHAPSEHTVDGKTYNLEMHVVHLYEDGSLGSALGIFFDIVDGGSTASQFLTELAPNLVTEEGTITGPVNFASFLGGVDMTNYYAYNGSLTTPPCTEGVKWSVASEVQPISAQQLSYFTKNWAGNDAYAGGKGNNRATQPWNDRKVYTSNPVSFGSLETYESAVILGASILTVVIPSLLF